MFVKFMSADAWKERVDYGLNLAAPSWDQVRDAILALDGISRTTVGLSDKEDDGRLMIVAGQWDGRLMVNVTLDNVDFFSLVDPSRTTANRILFVAGQDGGRSRWGYREVIK